MWPRIAQAVSSAVAAASNAAVFASGDQLPPNLIDLRKESGTKQGKKTIVYGRRKWSKVTGITLHQTACVLGERPERWLNVGCHVGITRSGKVLWLHDFDQLVVHGHGWNAQCVGIEIDGLYAGIQGDQRTVWDDPSTARHEQGMSIEPVQMEAVKDAIRWIVARVKARKGWVRALVAHRQSTDDRTTDPGSGIWQAVALPMMEELDLDDGGPGFTLGRGEPIPEAWDPSRTGIRYSARIK